MLTAVVERVREQRRALDPSRAAQVVVLAVPYLCGWLVRRTVRAIWWGVSFVYAAAVAGWRAGGGSS